MPPITFKHRFIQVFYILLVAASAYIFYKQAGANVDESEEIRDKVITSLQASTPHPLLISNIRRNRDYVLAIEKINASDYQRIWAVSDFLDPTFVLNYYIYPKQLVMSREMQDIVNYGKKIMQDDVQSYKPAQYDAVLVVKPGFVSLSETWESSQ